MTPPLVGLTQRADAVEGRAERRDALDQRWATFLDVAGCLAVAIPNVTADAAALLDRLDLDLLILTGGNDVAAHAELGDAAPERDRIEHALLAEAAARTLPVLGVCRGMQMMVVHAGGAVRRVEGHVGHSHEITVSSPLLGLGAGVRVVNSFHRWALHPSDLPADLVAAAHAPDGTVEAVRHVTRPLLGVMWHPERAGAAAAAPDPGDVALVRSLIRSRAS